MEWVLGSRCQRGVEDALTHLKLAAEVAGRGATGRPTRIVVDLSVGDVERLRLLAEELATSPRDALRQLARHGRQGGPWLLWLDVRHQLRTLLMQRVRPPGKRVGCKLPRVSDGE